MPRSTFLVNNALVVGLLGLSAFFATQSATFLTAGNIRNIAVNSSILAVVVVASAMLVIAGHLDLSIGSTIGLSGVLASMAVLDWDTGAAAGIALGVAVGAGVGLVNGVLCAVVGFSPIIVTLGMLGVIRGSTLLITVTPTYGLGGVFNTIGSGTAGPIPVLVIIAIATFLLGAVFLALTPWGRYVYAIGVNPQAAYLSGLPVRALPCLLYVATGASAGLAGVLFAARLDGASPSALGIGMEISALTAILLGGVAFAGGRGTLFGVFVAVVFLGVLQNGLVLMNVQPFVQTLVQGLALVVAAGLDVAALRLAARAEARRQVEQQSSSTLAGSAESVTYGKGGA
jgi:ribose/xylose/arabinose/galactoside ABC-type transport system permease subunit